MTGNDDLNTLAGKSLGHFRVVERIGAGGMAAVFKAYQPTLDRYVAIKVLPAYHARDPVFVKRFEQEARSVAKLAHPNIVQIHDFGEQDDITYIVMEYVDGGTLKDRLKKALPVAEAADYMIQAAEGLDCAHRNGIVHRDVKPANMLLRKDGHLLLSDFGIAKILEGTTNLTRVGTGIGTPQYMSPEQGMGQPVDRRSDIYSLGIVFFHCLTGHVPFTADSPITITVKHMNDPLPVEQLYAVGIPSPVVQVVQKMTTKPAQDRYQSAESLIDALTNALVSSNLVLPRSWRGVMPQFSSVSTDAASGQANVSTGNTSLPTSQPFAGAQPGVTLTCFRCGAPNPSTRLYCTTCGDDLSNRRASADRHLGPNGRPMLARLSIQNGPMAGHTYRFHQDVTTVGRTNGNDFVIAGRTVSRRHARLWFADGLWYLEDLQSANGTLLNNTRIYQPVVLNDGDVINFGDEVVVFTITYGP
ncbi:MAG TPA: protein kinase [Ktedonobacteraceae bacterium]|nr:protein kinase [Ktedonobacteraceae bacterium]